MKTTVDQNIENIVQTILSDYEDDKNINQVENFNQPNPEIIKELITSFFHILYPGFYRDKNSKYYNINNRLTVLIEDAAYKLTHQIAIALRQYDENQNLSTDELHAKAGEVTTEFLKKIPHIREYLTTDVEAFFEGDPAAYNRNEIILSYPGLYAITVARLAHELYLLQVPLIPRIMTEHAHSKTGIDIHPGATIGKYFFIDHGTGIVVGETTHIGEHVKIYQGVTLGALSTRGGQSLRGVQRHPTIEDRVTIYAGASILGGNTTIGHDSVIGSNAFITKSVVPNTTVSIKNLELNYKNGDDKFVNASDLNETWYYNI